jgi:P22 coat protein - gene protein 5
MANVFTNLAADIYKASDIVGRELVGVVTSGTINGGSEAAALGDTVRSSFTRTPTVGTVTPSMTLPEGTDQTVDNKTLVLDQTASVKIPYTGEDVKHLRNGIGYETVYGDQIAQAFRAIANQIESYQWGIVRAGASRAFGTAGTTPFGSNFNEVAELRQILVDNGTPMDGQSSLVINSLAGTKLRNLAQLQKVNESGSSNLLRQGELLNLQGLSLKESAAPVAVAKGTGTGYLVNGALAVGATTITVDTGTNTILAGDVVTFAADTVNKYVVASTLSGGSFTIAAPGLRVAIPDNNAITVGNLATANVAFHRAAVELAIRPFASPEGGDAADDRMVVVDPWSGLSFDMSYYKGYKKSMIDISCVYAGKVWKPEFVAQLLG